ncbi:cytochrome P450 [Streptomyces sp. NPDC051211]|uniref:cytochrome P450 n=1 Tax=Streptomyces sp. NPDC051211 TaxID=3154643 RepID=UPI00344BD25C
MSSTHLTPQPEYSFGQAPRALPLLGHTLPLLRDPHSFLTSLPAFGDLVRIRIGPSIAIMICDPELTRQVLLDDRTFDKAGLVLDRVAEVLGDGMATCPHSRHRRQRRLAQPAFHPSRFPDYTQTMREQADLMVDTWRDGQVLDVLPAMVSLTACTTAEALFKGSLPPHAQRQVIDDIITLPKGIYRRAISPHTLNRVPTPGNRRYRRARTRLRQTVDGIVIARQAEGTDHGDLLSALLATRNFGAVDGHDDLALTDAEISDQAITFFLGGVETAASALAWSLHLLGQHPAVTSRLQAEIDAVIAGESVSYEHLAELTYTRQILTETLRLRPPIWISTRVTSVDTNLGGHPIPAGTTIIYSPYLIHHRNDLYDNPEHFDPDRWDETRMTPQRSALVPFSGGPRKCIGDNFAIAEAIIALATIYARWQLRPIPNNRVRPAFNITLTPHHLRMVITERETKREKLRS